MSKLIDLMRQAGVQWPAGAEYAAQDGDDGQVFFFAIEPTIGEGYEVWDHFGCVDRRVRIQLEVADDWRTPVTLEQWGNLPPDHTSPDYMREQQRQAARNTERHTLVRELMLRHPELNGQQAIAQADEILETLEGLSDGR